jgi:heat shock protein HslJ/uncharacterized membrane protein
MLLTFLMLAMLQRPGVDTNLQKWNDGIDFYATGNEPLWSFDLDYDGTMRFQSLDASSLTTPAVEGQRAGDAIRYRAVAESGTLTVELVAEECRDTMADEVFTHRVTLEVQDRTEPKVRRFQGCGRYVIDPGLDAVWVLQSIDGEDFDSAGLPKGAPSLSLHIAELRASGHGGCNQLTGSFRVERDRITFGPAATTRMACPEMEREVQFLSAVFPKSHTFVLGERQLILESDDRRLVFREND